MYELFQFHFENTFQKRYLYKLSISWCHLPEIFSYLPAEFPLSSESRLLTRPLVLEQLGQVVSRLVRELEHGNTGVRLRIT